MKINITKKEYRLLVDMLFLGKWMMTAMEVDARYPEHERLLNRVFSYAKEMGASDLITHHKGSDDFSETQEYGLSMYDVFVTRYDENLFWEELINRLAERDLIKEYGPQFSVHDKKQAARLHELTTHYAKQFEEQELDQLVLKGYL